MTESSESTKTYQMSPPRSSRCEGPWQVALWGVALGGGCRGGFGWVALPTIVLAATTGAVLVFILASTVAREFFFSRADVVLDRVRSVFAKSPIRWLLTMRLIPFFPFWLVNILPALLSMKSRDYLFATLTMSANN